MSTVHIQACGGIVRKVEGQNQYILLIRKRKSPLWTLPKGHKENHESDQMTALREVKEETGYSCMIEKKAGEIQFQYTKDGQNYSENVVYYLMKPEQDNHFFDNHEIEEIRWVDIKETMNYLFYQNEKDIIRKLIEVEL